MGYLEVEGGCVVGDGWDAGGLQSLGQGIPVFGQEGVLGVDRVVAFGDDGGLGAGKRASFSRRIAACTVSSRPYLCRHVDSECVFSSALFS
jgi:hypothetical protein